MEIERIIKMMEREKERQEKKQASAMAKINEDPVHALHWNMLEVAAQAKLKLEALENIVRCLREGETQALRDEKNRLKEKLLGTDGLGVGVSSPTWECNSTSNGAREEAKIRGLIERWEYCQLKQVLDEIVN
jgi:hypothetical protein